MKQTYTSHQAVWYTCVCSDSKGVRGLRLFPAYTITQEGGKYKLCIYVLDTEYIARDYSVSSSYSFKILFLMSESFKYNFPSERHFDCDIFRIHFG